MGKIARQHDANLVPERGFPLSPAADANIRDRIQSSLIPRGKSNPTPTAYPPLHQRCVHRSLGEGRLARSKAYKTVSRLGPTQASAPLVPFEGTVSDMGAVRFDGPAGQISDPNDAGSSRRPSHPHNSTNRRSSGDIVSSKSMSGLNQKAHRDIVGREAAIQPAANQKQTSTSKKSNQSRLPRYHLRTLPPAIDVNKIVRPNPLHVPGSYRSEVDTRKGYKSATTSPSVKEAAETPDNEITAVPFHTGQTDEHSHQAAVDALKDVVEHDQHQHSEPTSDAHNAPQYRIMKPHVMSERPRRKSQEIVADNAVSQQPENPNVPIASGLNREEVPHHFDSSLFVIGDDSQQQDIHPSEHRVADNKEGASAKQPLSSNNQGLSVLLAELPPVKQITSEGVLEAQQLTELSADEKRNSSNGQPHVVNPASHPMNIAMKPTSKAYIDEPPPAKNLAEEDEDTLPLIPDSRRSSKATTRLSSVSRAMSMVSEMSARSGIKAPSFRSSSAYHKIGSHSNLTARPSSHSNHRSREVILAKEADFHSIPLSRLETGDSRPDSSTLQTQQNYGEGFTKVITDLESVLKEAIDIAGQNTSSGHNEAGPLLSPTRHTGRSRGYSDESVSYSDSISNTSEGADEEDHNTTFPGGRVSYRPGRVAIKEPASEALYQGHFNKTHDATPYPAQTRHASTIPVTGETDGIEPKVDRQRTRRDFLELPQASAKTHGPDGAPIHEQRSFTSTDWTTIRVPPRPSKLRLEIQPPPPAPEKPPSSRVPVKEQHTFLVRDHGGSEDTMTRTQIRDYVHAHQRPPIQPRLSSMRLRTKATAGRAPRREELNLPDGSDDDFNEPECECVPYVADFETSGLNYHPVFQAAMNGESTPGPRHGNRSLRPPRDTLTPLRDNPPRPGTSRNDEAPPVTNTYSLEGRHHFSIREPRGFSLSRSHRRSPIARDWSVSRKRWTATVVCITTAFVGLFIGIYAGEVPAIQYAIADEHHYTILGNVFFFIGIAISTALFYPLPLLHGRKPYTLGALAILLPLQFPQAIAIQRDRSPYVATYRVGLLLPRVFAGLIMGFASINFITTLLDLFGASLQSGNPHQEVVNENDVRRHGGGMGVWLSIWTWCFIGSLGLGFLIGAEIISGLNVSWGFWILIVLNAAVLLLNIVAPEVRRSAYRRSMAEVRTGDDVSRRVARGEIKMHLDSTGPVWFWEELIAGHVLAFRMLVQPGFAVLALYQGWIYGQVVLVIVLLGALLSRYYYFHPEYVGLGVGIIPLGALLAIPFQKASLFSRARHRPQRTDSMTFQKRVTWTSHLVRRAIFMISLPFAGLAYTLASNGPPTHYVVPIIFAGLIAFLSNLAIAECNGLIMETFDTSDLQPGMTGRPRRVLPEAVKRKRTNFSCFPRVTAGFAIAQTFAFGIGAIVTAWGGVIERHVGAQKATGVMAGVLMILTLLLLAALWRYKTVQIIPSERFGTNILAGPEDEWKPVIIGNPSGTTRRMSLLELGSLSRWSEIRRRNRLVPEERG